MGKCCRTRRRGHHPKDSEGEYASENNVLQKPEDLGKGVAFVIDRKKVEKKKKKPLTETQRNKYVKNGPQTEYCNPLVSTVTLPSVSVTPGHLRSKNIAWRILEANNSRLTLGTVLSGA